ncbi:MAG: alpha/beta hydrolase [Deltaproteobacteria bacterium]
MILLVLGLTSLWLTYNVTHPLNRGPLATFAAFIGGWMWGELALHLIVIQAVVVLMLAWGGGLEGMAGKAGLLLMVVSWVMAARDYRGCEKSAAVAEEALTVGLGQQYRQAVVPEFARKFEAEIRWNEIARPFKFRLPEVEKVADICFSRERGINIKLDVYHHRSKPSGAPVLLQIHGGGWIFGSKNEQAMPLMNLMASHGWVCVSVDYRLSPHATFPEHLIDVKKAMAWIREHGGEYGADPDCIVVTGGSAGGHLAAMVALTANDPEYQPGFEDVDTSVRGCIPFYGVYAFTDREDVPRSAGMAKLFETKVMKGSLQELPEAYHRASPVERIDGDIPPFFVVHGALDSLVPVKGAQRFVELLKETSHSPVCYAEIPGAQHAFEIFTSLRSQPVVDAAERFAAWCYSDYMAALKGQDLASAAEPGSVEVA